MELSKVLTTTPVGASTARDAFITVDPRFVNCFLGLLLINLHNKRTAKKKVSYR